MLYLRFFGYSSEKSKTGFSKVEISPSLTCIVILNGAQNFKFLGFWYASLWLNFVHFSEYKRLGYSLEIKKKRGLSIDLDIHHSKVPSSGLTCQGYLCESKVNRLANGSSNFKLNFVSGRTIICFQGIKISRNNFWINIILISNSRGKRVWGWFLKRRGGLIFKNKHSWMF